MSIPHNSLGALFFVSLVALDFLCVWRFVHQRSQPYWEVSTVMRNIRCWLGHSWGMWTKAYTDVGKDRIRWVRLCDKCYAVEAKFTEATLTPVQGYKPVKE